MKQASSGASPFGKSEGASDPFAVFSTSSSSSKISGPSIGRSASTTNADPFAAFEALQSNKKNPTPSANLDDSFDPFSLKNQSNKGKDESVDLAFLHLKNHPTEEEARGAFFWTYIIATKLHEKTQAQNPESRPCFPTKKKS